jgi:hypothetical protein
LFIKPGTVSKRRIINPNTLPGKDCFVENKVSCEVNIDSFHEIFRKTNVTTTTKTAEFKTISNGIGKSPTLIIPCLSCGEIFTNSNAPQ